MKRLKSQPGTRLRSVHTVVARGKVVLDVLVECPDWLPFTPRINPDFIRPLADAVVRRELAA